MSTSSGSPESRIKLPSNLVLDPNSAHDVKLLVRHMEEGGQDMGLPEGRIIHLELCPPPVGRSSSEASSGEENTSNEEDTMQCVQHVSQIPAVQEALGAATSMYSKVKESNPVCKSTLETAESAIQGVVATTAPVQRYIKTPIRTVDKMLLQGILRAEEKVPALALPCQQMLQRTKQCVTNSVKPCSDGLSAVKSCSANVIKKVITKSLLALPDGLLPEGVDKDKLAAGPEQNVAADANAEEFQDAQQLENPQQ